MLKKAFRSAGTILGEAIIAIAGLGTVYGLGWASGAKSGAKLSDLLNRTMNEEEQRKAAEAAASKEEEEPADEPDKEQQEDDNSLPEVEFDE